MTARNSAVRKCTFPLVAPGDDEPDGPAHLERGHANASAHARVERLRGDLRATQQNQRVNRFERNPLTSLRRRHQQRPPAMLHAGAMIPNVHRAQVAHPNTMVAMYRSTLRGALVSSGRQ